MTLSIRATLANHLQGFRLLKKRAEDFSLRKWVADSSENRLLSKHSMVEGFLGRDDRETAAYLGIREVFERGADDKITRQTQLRKRSTQQAFSSNDFSYPVALQGE